MGVMQSDNYIAADAFDNSPNLKNINVAASNKVYTSSTDGKIHKK